MKKICLVIITMSLLIFAACTSIENTDLKNIKIDNISLGESIDRLDLSKYETRNEVLNEYNYEFKGLQIKTNANNKIDKIWLNILEQKFLTINAKNNFEHINQITDTLGSNYKEYWYDKEQGLKSHEYVDNEAKIKANFVYNDISNQQLVWVILENE